MTTGLGFIINEGKFQLTPSQEITSLGADIVLQRGIAVPTKERIDNLQICVKLFLSIRAAPAQGWLKLLGFMASLVDVVLWCGLRMRPLQMHLLAHYRPKADLISLLVPVARNISQHLQWWLQDQNTRSGQSFPRKDPQITISTDASNEGWGAYLHPDKWQEHGTPRLDPFTSTSWSSRP